MLWLNGEAWAWKKRMIRSRGRYGSRAYRQSCIARACSRVFLERPAVQSVSHVRLLGTVLPCQNPDPETLGLNEKAYIAGDDIIASVSCP